MDFEKFWFALNKHIQSIIVDDKSSNMSFVMYHLTISSEKTHCLVFKEKNEIRGKVACDNKSIKHIHIFK